MACGFLSASAQVSAEQLVGKYRLQGRCDLWDGSFGAIVTPHEDFTFTIMPGEEGEFLLSSFFYGGMDADWVPLEYSATARYSPSEVLLYVYPTEWMWDNYMSIFMDPYSHDPMLYFAVERDSQGAIHLTTTPNSVGFYALTDMGEGSKFYYALDYPEALHATKLQTYASVTANTLAGDYTLAYNDFDGKPHTTTFTIERDGPTFLLTGMFGDKEKHILHFDEDGCGVYFNVQRKVNEAGLYTYYFGSVVGECRVGFSFDAKGRLVADNYFTYTSDWTTWHDALDAVAQKADQAGVAMVQMPSAASAATYDLAGRPASTRAGIMLREGRKSLVR